jgi:hypothetical protein
MFCSPVVGPQILRQKGARDRLTRYSVEDDSCVAPLCVVAACSRPIQTRALGHKCENPRTSALEDVKLSGSKDLRLDDRKRKQEIADVD